MERSTGPPTTPSSGPSRTGRLLMRSCERLQWIMESVKRAKVAGKVKERNGQALLVLPGCSRQIVALIKFKRIFKFRFICSIYIS